jgi:hypothetical protein
LLGPREQISRRLMGLRSFIRGDRYLEGAYDAHSDESRSLPRPENELPLLGAYTASTVTPTAALAIADVWAAVRVLSDAASSLPLHAYRRTSAGERERVTGGKLNDLLEASGLKPMRLHDLRHSFGTLACRRSRSRT